MLTWPDSLIVPVLRTRRLTFSWTLLAGLVLGVAAGLRFFRLDYLGLWGDEAHTAALARLDPPTLLRAAANGGYPPLYFLFIHYWQQFVGTSEFALRLPSALLGLLLVGVAFAVGSQLFGRTTGLLAGGLTAVAPMELPFAQEARVYMLLMMLSLGATWSVWRAVTTGQGRFWIAYTGLMTLALYAHYSVALLLPAHGLFCFLQRQTVPRPVPRFVAAVGGILLLFAAWLPSTLHAVHATGVTLSPQLAAYWSVLVSFVSDETSAGVGVRDVLAGAVGLSLLALIIRATLRQRDSPAIQVLLCTVLVPLVLELPVSVEWSLARHTAYILPAFEVLGAWAIVTLGPGKLRLLCTAAVLLVIAVTLPRFYQGYRATVISNQVSEDWRGLVHQLNQLDARSLVLIAPRFYMMEMDYYFTGRAAVQALPGPLDLTTVDFTGGPEISLGGLAAYNGVQQAHQHVVLIGVLRGLVDPQGSIETWLRAQGWHAAAPGVLAQRCLACAVEEFNR